MCCVEIRVENVTRYRYTSCRNAHKRDQLFRVKALRWEKVFLSDWAFVRNVSLPLVVIFSTLIETAVLTFSQCGLYNNVTSVWIFICCWPWSITGHTQMASNPRQQTCFSFFMPPKSFKRPFEFLLYKTNRLHFSACVYCNRSQMTSQRVKNNSHATRLRLVSYFFQFVLYTLWRHLWSITVHTHGKMLLNRIS